MKLNKILSPSLSALNIYSLVDHLRQNCFLNKIIIWKKEIDNALSIVVQNPATIVVAGNSGVIFFLKHYFHLKHLINTFRISRTPFINQKTEKMVQK